MTSISVILAFLYNINVVKDDLYFRFLVCYFFFLNLEHYKIYSVGTYPRYAIIPPNNTAAQRGYKKSTLRTLNSIELYRDRTKVRFYCLSEEKKVSCLEVL